MREIATNELGIPRTGSVGEETPQEAMPSPEVETPELSEEPLAEAKPLTPVEQAFDPKNTLRIVVVGGSDRLLLASIEEFQRGLRKPISRITFPTNLYEAGIQSACADVLIFDLEKHDLLDVNELIKVSRTYAPRAVVVALLEEGMGVGSIPERVGVHLEVTTPFSAYGVSHQIDALLYGPEE